jgi:excisionase family DNA binding protein
LPKAHRTLEKNSFQNVYSGIPSYRSVPALQRVIPPCNGEDMANKKIKEIDPLALAFRPLGAARVIGVGTRTVERLISTGELRSVRIGKCRLIRRKDLEAFLEARVASDTKSAA